MKTVIYYQSGPYVAYKHDPNTEEIIRVCSRPGAAAVAQADYALLPLCAFCDAAHYESIRAAALQELCLVDQEAIYQAQIAEYEAKGVVANYLDVC